jgi:hypothetical protein
VSDRAAGLTRARKAWRKIVEPMNTEQVQDLLTSDEELSWLRSVAQHLLEPTVSARPLTRVEVHDRLAAVLADSRGEPPAKTGKQ